MGKTSWEVKRRYNAKTYSKLTVELKKELVAKFKEKCKEKGDAQAAVIRTAIEEYIEKN